MSDLLKGKLCLIFGIANKWSLAYAVAELFRAREPTSFSDVWESIKGIARVALQPD